MDRKIVVLMLVMLVCLSLVSAGNYKFQNTTGSTLMIINGAGKVYNTKLVLGGIEII